MHIVGFSTSTPTMRLDETKGSGTDTDMECMDTSMEAFNQQRQLPRQRTCKFLGSTNSFSRLKAYSSKPNFIKDHQQQQGKKSREHQPFYNFVATEADNFQADVLNLLHKCM